MKELKDSEWLLLTKAVKKECTHSEQREFDSWFKSDPIHQEIYYKVKLDWETAKELQEEDHPLAEVVWEKIAESISEDGKSGKVIWIRRNWRFVAAVALLVVGSFWMLREGGSDIHHFNPVATIASDANEVTETTLSDGSRVWLDKGATLQTEDFNQSDNRLVSLTGQAYFEIARDEDKPFVIQVNDVLVEVLGTAFNINALNPEDHIEVGVTHGKVSFKNEAEEVILTKGEVGTRAGNTGLLAKSRMTDPNLLAWKTGVLVFENVPLAEVCQILGKHYKMTIQTSQKDQKLNLTATFDNQSLQEVLEVIAFTLDLNLKETPEGAVFE